MPIDNMSKLDWQRSFYNARIQEMDPTTFKSKSEVPSVYKKLKFFAIIGSISGLFPVKNCYTATSSAELMVKKLSAHYFWSLLTLAAKIFTLVVVLVIVSGFYILDALGLVDTLAWITVYAVIFCFGGITHVVHVTRTKNTVRLLQIFDLYNDKYNCDRITPVLSRKVGACMFASILVVITPPWIIYNSVTRLAGINYEGMQKYTHFGEDITGLLFLILICVGMIATEYGVTFYYIILFYFGAVLKDRLEEIVEHIQYKSVVRKNVDTMKIGKKGDDKINSTKLSIFTSNHGNGYKNVKFSAEGYDQNDGAIFHSQKSWSAISQQYLDFLDVLDQYSDFIGSSFIVLFATLTISLVCMVFCNSSAQESQFTEDSGQTLMGIVVVSFFRIVFLADVGEIFLKKHSEMLKLLVKVRHSAHFMPQERVQFKQLFMTATTIPVRLSAKGFFTVSRQNVTSIISVIITYIIVLVQFRMSSGDEALVNKNLTRTFVRNAILNEHSSTTSPIQMK